MFWHKHAEMEDHQHSTVEDARDCEYYHAYPEPPTCSICDGYHKGRCPLEDYEPHRIETDWEERMWL